MIYVAADNGGRSKMAPFSQTDASGRGQVSGVKLTFL